MKRKLLWMAGLVLMFGALAGALQAQDKDITGNWQGTLQAGQGLRTLLKISKDDGKLKAVMYSIDQGGQPIAVTSVSIQGSSVNFAIKPLDVIYVGTLNPDGNTISGNATQNGQAHVLNLEHVTAENTWAIPEPPKSMDPNAVPKFDVITVKLSRPDQPGKGFTVRGRHVMTFNTNMNDLVTFAYSLHTRQLINAPEWFATEKFDLDGVPDVEGRPSAQQMRVLLQSALIDRFKLTFHQDKKELSVYVLEVGKGGPKLTETIHKPADPRGFNFRNFGVLTVTNSTMQDFCNGMQGAVMNKPVVDHTSLTARYDFTLNWTPDDSQFEAMGGYRAPATEDPSAPPALSTAMMEQLGLKFEAAKTPAEVFVIDHVEQPSEN